MQALFGYDVVAELAPGHPLRPGVEALGGHGELVTEPGELGPALDRAFATKGVSLVNVLTDPADAYPRSQQPRAEHAAALRGRASVASAPKPARREAPSPWCASRTSRGAAHDARDRSRRVAVRRAASGSTTALTRCSASASCGADARVRRSSGRARPRRRRDRAAGRRRRRRTCARGARSARCVDAIAEVAEDREVEAAGERGAVDRRDRRQREAQHRVVVAVARRPELARRTSSSSAARGNSERSKPAQNTGAGAGDHDALDRLVARRARRARR